MASVIHIMKNGKTNYTKFYTPHENFETYLLLMKMAYAN